MQKQYDIPLKKTFLGPSHPEENNKKMARVALGELDVSTLREDQIKELKLKLLEKGLTLDKVLSKYKDVIEAKDVKYKGSDVLKALDSVREMMELKGNEAHSTQVRAMIQQKTASEITTTLIEITGATQDYIKKLQERQNR